MSDRTFSDDQLAKLQSAFHQGSAEASDALTKWLGRPIAITFDSLDRLPLVEATGVLGADDPICFCSMDMPESLPGELLVAFDDAAGLAICDMALGAEIGTASQWGEMEQSAVLESTNILCCAYLGAIVSTLGDGGALGELIPAPPKFRREFAESLLQFALMGQAMAGDDVIVVRTRFHADAQPLDWTLLWIPDPQALETLQQSV